ncbi:MAG TPA: alpha/beta hydrolase [Pyrinomonadaceae bacterium]|jgi:pimeloyl-ACP methyl ester carboxylesterase
MEAVPRFEPSDCPVPVPEGERVRCGYLFVRENRARPASPVIKLPIIILRSDSPTPAPDAVLRTLGGPGASSLRMIRGRRASPWLRERDMIIFEQRGTRYAQPALTCPEVDAAKSDSARRNLDERTEREREVRAARACRARLVRQGIDLAAYNSASSAADIEDLRRALGYRQLNLYGVSYSARLMLTVMRDYPRGVRSVVLESTLPPQVNYDEAGVDVAAATLDLLFQECVAEPECAKAYPNLKERFYELVRRANARPFNVAVKQANAQPDVMLRLKGNHVIEWAMDELAAGGENVVKLPAEIDRLARGDAGALAAYAESKLNPGGYAWGMRYSVWCREEMPFQSRRKIDAQSERRDGLNGFTIQGALPAICDAWRVPAAPRIENAPVTSDIPTLILAGEFDSYTPPAWARLAARTLRHSYFYELPGMGHGVSFGSVCAREAAAAFFADPARAPQVACLAAMTRPKFLIKS